MILPLAYSVKSALALGCWRPVPRNCFVAGFAPVVQMNASSNLDAATAVPGVLSTPICTCWLTLARTLAIYRPLLRFCAIEQAADRGRRLVSIKCQNHSQLLRG